MPETTELERKLTRIKVEGLLGQFDHDIPFESAWQFVIVYGPNGVGKTRLLELTKGLIDLNVQKLGRTPFDRLILQFDDGSELSAASPPQGDDPEGDEVQWNVQVTLTQPGMDPVHAQLDATRDRPIREWLEATSWRQIDDDLWEDSTDGELATLGELRQRFGPVIQRSARGARRREPPLVPDELKNFCRSVPVSLVETQRLLNYRPVPNRTRRPGAHRTVSVYSDDLRARLREALAENSRLGQSLDRSFPRRIIEAGRHPEATETAIRERYERQSSIRSRLAELSIAASETEVPLPDRELSEFETRALWVYLDDSEEKLASFTPLVEKLTLLEDIVSARFVGKHVRVDAESGLSIRRRFDDVEIPVESLSSGEQHELIMAYELIFRVTRGSTVLIDEPEISLHVAWQHAFLTDLMKIAELAGLRFVVATHSPQIINTWVDRTVALDSDVDV